MEFHATQARLTDVQPFEADDHGDVKIDIQEHLVRNAASTFVGRIEGDSLVEYGIHDGDLAVVDRSVEPVDGEERARAGVARLGAPVVPVRRGTRGARVRRLGRRDADHPDGRVARVDDATCETVG